MAQTYLNGIQSLITLSKILSIDKGRLHFHVLVPILPAPSWHLLSAPLLLGVSNIKIIIFSIELVLSTFLRWLKVINRASGLFDTINTLLILVDISYYEIIF